MLCDASDCVVRVTTKTDEQCRCAWTHVWVCVRACVCVNTNTGILSLYNAMGRKHVIEHRAGARPKFARYEAEIGTEDGCMFPAGARVGAKKKEGWRGQERLQTCG